MPSSAKDFKYACALCSVITSKQTKWDFIEE